MKKIKNYEGLIRVIPFIVIFLILSAFLTQFCFLLLDINVDDLSKKLPTKTQFIINIFNVSGVVISVFLCSVFVYKEKFIDTLGLRIKGRIKNIAWGLLVGFIIMLIGFAPLLLFSQIELQSISIDTEEILFYIAIFIMVSLTEEFLFRGILLRNLIISFNKYVSLIVSSILFALLHSINPHISLFSLFNLFLAGITLGMTVIYTKNLWFSISLHFSWNFFQSLFGFNVSGQEGYSIFNTEINRSNLLNGGEFGFEGSILCTIFLIMIILYFFISVNKKHFIFSLCPKSSPQQ